MALVAICLNSSPALSQEYKYNISGQIENLPDDITIYLIKFKELNGKTDLDTVQRTKSRDGLFSFTQISSTEGEVGFIKIDTSNLKINGKQNDAIIFMDNANIKLIGTIKTWPKIKIEGSPSTQNYHQMVERLLAFKTRLDNDPKFSKSLTIFDQMDTAISILQDYPDALSTPALALQYTFKPDNNAPLYNSWSNRVKNSHYGKIYKEFLDHTKGQEEMRQGKIIPNFTVVLQNGSPTNIHDLIETNESKLTLVDFWASWCSPCRKEIPNLKETLNKFSNDNFKIISVSIDLERENWVKAVDEEKMPWLQAIELKKSASKVFSFISIPAYILVDNKKKMIAFQCSKSAFPSFGPLLQGENLQSTINNLIKLEVSKK